MFVFSFKKLKHTSGTEEQIARVSLCEWCFRVDMSFGSGFDRQHVGTVRILSIHAFAPHQ